MIMKVLQKQISGCKYISFDIFDTLLERAVPNPRDVFELVERKYNKLYPNCQINDYKIQRIKAEDMASQKSGSKELLFDDIYSELQDVYINRTVEQLKEIELLIEYQVIYRKKKGCELYSYLIENGYKIILTSDMYMPSSFIKKLLDKCDIHNYHKLFISSESGNKKSNGTMYSYLCKELNVGYKDILHIGDNIKSDYYQARKKGMKAFWLRDKSQKGVLSDEVILQRFIDSKGKSKGLLEESIGFNSLGPLLYGFSFWLSESVKLDRISKILFLSREGKILQNAYNCIEQEPIENEYFHVSRQALILPSIWFDPELEAVEKAASLSRSVTIEVVLKRLGIYEDINESYLSEFDLSLETQIDGEHLSANNSFVDFYESVKLSIIEKSKESYRNLKYYLEDYLVEGNTAIVDIGWNGSMQKVLQKIINEDFPKVKLYGYYMGVNPFREYVRQNCKTMKGYIFGSNYNPKKYIEEECMRDVFEILFLARHGSVRKIEENSEVVLFEYENNKAISKSIEIFQNSAIEFVAEFKELMGELYIDINSSCYYEKVYDIGLQPSKEISRFFGNMVVFDLKSFHISEVEKKSWTRELKATKWKIGYLTELFGSRLPYYKLIYYKKLFDLKKNKQ